MQIFDGHNDLLTQLSKAGAPDGFATGLSGHIDLPKMTAGGMAGGFFAMWVPSPVNLADLTEQMRQSHYDVPLPPQIGCAAAQTVVLSQAALLQELAEAGHLDICTSVAQIRACADAGRIAAILHLEGAEAIDPEMQMLERLHDMGLRSLGPVWSRPTRFAEGVPFGFPASPDTGGGLTADGVRLVEVCNARGILIDLAHITEAGFWDVAHHSDAPLVATHSNAHAICAHTRNLTDDQLRAVGDSGGVVGLNFATAMLRPDGKMLPECGFDVMCAHLDHMMAKAGAQSVALGSDFDGAIVPNVIGDASGLPRLIAAMEAHGYDGALIERIAFGNWMRVLEATWR